ncbi:cytochrome c oxidase assembly protein [Nocardioides marmoraquaticus]
MAVAALMLLGYTYLVRRRPLDERWPPRTTAWWVSGCVVAVWATNGTPQALRTTLFSMYTTQLVLVGLLVPALLTLGRPVALLRGHAGASSRSTGVTQRIADVVVRVRERLPLEMSAVGVSCLVFVATSTPVVVANLESRTVHYVTLCVALATGGLLATGVTRSVTPRCSVRRRSLILLTVAVVLAAYWLSLVNQVTPRAWDWFVAVDRAWGPSVTGDQDNAAVIGFVCTVVSVLLMLELAVVGREAAAAESR